VAKVARQRLDAARHAKRSGATKKAFAAAFCTPNDRVGIGFGART
jgi:hypothetical protein